VPALKIGYARVSTDAQDLTAQRDALQALRVESDRIYVDHGSTGTTRERPGLRQALAACRAATSLWCSVASAATSTPLLLSVPAGSKGKPQTPRLRLRGG
jgi:hypothetical protein